MKLIIGYFEEGKAEVKQFELEAPANLRQVMSYVEEMQPELWTKLKNKTFKLALSVRLLEDLIFWEGEGDFESLQRFEHIYLIEDLGGEAFFTTLFTFIATNVAAAAFAAGAGGTIFGVGTAALIGTVVGALAVVALSAGLSMVLGAIMKALSPSKKAERLGRSSIFNQQLNSDGEGYPVPWLLGSGLGGGVLVAKVIHTYDASEDTLDNDLPYPSDVKNITKANLHNAVEGKWYKLVS